MGALLCSERSRATQSMLAMAGLAADKINHTKELQKSTVTIPPWGWCDTYVIIITAVYAPLAMIMYIWTTFAILPLFILGKLYMVTCLSRPTDRIRHGIVFKFLLALTFPWAFIIYFAAYVYWMFIFFTAMAFGFPIGLIRIFLFGQGSKIVRNFAMIWPYFRGNFQSYYMTAVAILGQIDRQSVLEFTFGQVCSIPPGGYATSVAFTPIVKYMWHANPFVWVLDEVYCNQWTPPITNLPEADVIDDLRIFISRFMHTMPDRNAVHRVKFSAHYPWPPHDFQRREILMGLQWPKASKFVQFTHLVHTVDGKASYDGLVGVKCRSETGKTAVAEVTLWWFAYHFLTGRVELNYRYDQGLEHPMWCIMAPDSYLALLSYTWVNNLFEAFAPQAVSMIERIQVEEGAGDVHVLPGFAMNALPDQSRDV